MKSIPALQALAALAASACLAIHAAEPAIPAATPGSAADSGYRPTRDLSQFFAKIRAGRPVTVMGIGGSVTEGHSWAHIATQWLREQFPGKDIRYVDGALGGTGPALTIFRLRRDILPFRPDLVFIEYAVNSYGSPEQNFKALDGIVQQLLAQPQKPDIVFVYVGNDKGERALEKVQPLARSYGFPEVDPRRHLQTLLDAGKLTWRDVSADQIHPNRRGHEIYSEPVIALLQDQSARPGQPTPEPPVPQPFASDQWTTATVLPVAAAAWDGPWQAAKPPESTARFLDEVIECDQVGATMAVSAHTTTFGVMCAMTADSGMLAWSIDGGKEQEVNLSNTYVLKGGAWFRNILFAENLPPGVHTLRLEIRPKWDQATGNFIRIGGFCVTNPLPARGPAGGTHEPRPPRASE